MKNYALKNTSFKCSVFTTLPLASPTDYMKHFINIENLSYEYPSAAVIVEGDLNLSNVILNELWTYYGNCEILFMLDLRQVNTILNANEIYFWTLSQLIVKNFL